MGKHVLSHWSSTQATVALSSAEAELNAMVKGISELLGVLNLLSITSVTYGGELLTDSSAARGIVHRQGSSKVKHLEVRQLWVQEVVSSGRVKCVKVPRAVNVADALTHHWSPKDGETHFRELGLQSPVQLTQ